MVLLTSDVIDVIKLAESGGRIRSCCNGNGDKRRRESSLYTISVNGKLSSARGRKMRKLRRTPSPDDFSAPVGEKNKSYCWSDITLDRYGLDPFCAHQQRNGTPYPLCSKWRNYLSRKYPG